MIKWSIYTYILLISMKFLYLAVSYPTKTSSQTLLVASQYFTVYIYHNLLNHSPTTGEILVVSNFTLLQTVLL